MSDAMPGRCWLTGWLALQVATPSPAAPLPQPAHLQRPQPQVLRRRKQLGAQVQAKGGQLPTQCQRLQKDQHPAGRAHIRSQHEQEGSAPAGHRHRWCHVGDRQRMQEWWAALRSHHPAL